MTTQAQRSLSLDDRAERLVCKINDATLGMLSLESLGLVRVACIEALRDAQGEAASAPWVAGFEAGKQRMRAAGSRVLQSEAQDPRPHRGDAFRAGVAHAMSRYMALVDDDLTLNVAGHVERVEPGRPSPLPPPISPPASEKAETEELREAAVRLRRDVDTLLAQLGGGNPSDARSRSSVAQRLRNGQFRAISGCAGKFGTLRVGDIVRIVKSDVRHFFTIDEIVRDDVSGDVRVYLVTRAGERTVRLRVDPDELVLE